MEDPSILVDMLQLRAGYKQVNKDIKTHLIKANYTNRLRSYGIAKKNVTLKYTPRLISDKKLQSSEFLIENTTFLKQTSHFGKLAQNATMETKPLILHYAENSLFAFFVYSLFSFPGHSKGHGLDIRFGRTLQETKVKILKNGFFPRIIDCYTILGVNTHFSILRYENIPQEFQVKNDNPYPLSNEPLLNLQQIIAIRETLGDQQSGHYYDIIDFVLLFFASSLARYRPYLWHKIVEGEEGTEFIWFKLCFDRFDILFTRLIRALVKISKGRDPEAALSLPDFMLSQDYV